MGPTTVESYMSNGYKRKNGRFLSRVISILLLIVMLSEEFLGSGNIVLAAETEETAVIEEETDAGSSDSAGAGEAVSEETDTEDLDILFEMEGNRDQSSKHYRLSDGSIMAADYGMDIHYQKDGQWEIPAPADLKIQLLQSQ